MCVSLPSEQNLEKQQLAYAVLQRQPVVAARSCPFWVRPAIMPMDLLNLASCEMSFRVICQMFAILQLINFVVVTFLFQHTFRISDFLSHSRAQFPRDFLFWDVATDATPNHWACYFQGSLFLLSYSATCSGSMRKVHITLQELQAVELMLDKVGF